MVGGRTPKCLATSGTDLPARIMVIASITLSSVISGTRLTAGRSALGNDLALELGERRHHVHLQASRRGRQVDAFSQGLEAAAARQQFIDQLDAVHQRAAETIQLPHHEDVTLLAIADRLMQLGSRVDRAGHFFGEDFVAAGLTQRRHLQRRVLVARRHTGVANSHVRALIS
jgi:hypothetical protein